MKDFMLLNAMGGIDADLVEESMVLFDVDPSKKISKPQSAFSRFFNSGWGVAVICAFVGIGIIAGIVWAGRNAPDEPPFPFGESDEGSDNTVVTEPVVAETEAPTEAPTESPTEPATEGVLYDPITEGGLTFISAGDGTCAVSAVDKSLAGAVSVPEVSPYGDRVTTIASYGFQSCTWITSLTLPDSVTVIKSGAFLGCSGLVSIQMPERLTSMGTGVFQKCTKLRSIIMPEGIKTLPRQTFETCTELQSVEFKEGLVKIDDNAFNGCSRLTTLYIPATLESVGSSAFLNCCGLSRIYFGGTRQEWEAVKVHKMGNSQFSGTPVTTLN